MPFERMHRYPTGAIVQRRNLYRYVKTEHGFKAEHRLVAEHKILRRELQKNERVFHKDCEEVDNNSVENLVVIRFRTNPFRPLPASKVIFIPSRQTA